MQESGCLGKSGCGDGGRPALAERPCGEPMFDNTESWNSLLEDRKACAAEIATSSAGEAYCQNPATHQNYISRLLQA